MTKIDAVPGARSTEPERIGHTRGFEHRSDAAMRNFRLFRIRSLL